MKAKQRLVLMKLKTIYSHKVKSIKELSFKQEIERLMVMLPEDKVTTYGDLASMAGRPTAARIVGGIAHFGNPDLPWHRLVNKSGGLARGYPDGMRQQQLMLEQDGIHCTDFKIENFEDLRWKPENL